MKYLFPILVFFLCGFVLTAAPKVAVTGDISLVDLVTAELSGKEDWELLERSGINKILAEHGFAEKKLSTSEFQRYFPHVDIWVIVQPDRLFIFNAKDGYRLADRKILEGEMTSGLVHNELLKGVWKKSAEDAIYLSTVSVREVGISRRVKNQINEFVDAVESALLENPKVQMLERSRLTMVNEERKLTEKKFELIPSTRLLTFEFEPGRDGNINAKILVGNMDYKNFGRIERKDVFQDIPASVRFVTQEIETSLARKEVRVSKQNLVESERFFRESAELYANATYDKALTRIQAAIALEPDKPEFLDMELKIRSKRCMQMIWNDQRIEASEKIADLFDAFMKTKPEKSVLETAFRSYSEIFLFNSSNMFADISDANLKKMRQIGARYRVHRNAIRPIVFPSSLPGKMDSIPDLMNYIRQMRYGDSLRFFDLGSMLQDHLDTEVKLVFAADDFVRRNPDKTVEVNRIMRSLYGWIIQDLFAGKSEWSAYIQKTSPLLDLLEKSPITVFRNECIAIRFIQRVDGKTISREKLIQETDCYLNELVKFSPSALEEIVMTRRYPESDLQTMHNRVLTWLSAYMLNQSRAEAKAFVVERIQRITNGKNEKVRIPMLIEQLSSDSRKTLPELLKEKDALRRFASARIQSSQYGDWLHLLAAELLKQDGEPSSIVSMKHEIFTGLNKDLLENYDSWSKLSKKSSVMCLGAVEFQSELYVVLLCRGEEPGIYLAKYATESGCRILSRIDGLRIMPRAEIESEATVYPAASDKIVVVPGAAGLHIFDLKRNSWLKIEDPMGKDALVESAILGDRIYLLYSERGAVDDRKLRAADRQVGKRTGSSALISYNLEGKDRVTHFHTNRIDKLNMMDSGRFNGEVLCNLKVLDKNRLVFQSETGVWEFHIISGKFRKISNSFTKFNHYVRMTVADGKIYVTSIAYPTMFSVIDPGNYRRQILLGFYQSERLLRNPPVCILKKTFLNVDRQNAYRNANHSFFRKGDSLYIGGMRPCCLNLIKPEESPVLALPPCFQIVQIGNKIAFISLRHLFILSEKESGL